MITRVNNNSKLKGVKMQTVSVYYNVYTANNPHELWKKQFKKHFISNRIYKRIF